MLDSENMMFPKQLSSVLLQEVKSIFKDSIKNVPILNETNEYLLILNLVQMTQLPQEVIKQVINVVPAKQLSLLLAGSCLLFVGCGKKTEESEPGREVVQTPVVTNVEKFLEKQDVVCEAGQLCPSYIAKIVIIESGRVKYCTGFLVESEGDVVATSSSCLTDLLRVNDQDCSQSVTFFFPKNFNTTRERVGCLKVLKASDVNVDEAALTRNDISFLRMEKPNWSRKRAYFNKKFGVSDKQELSGWAIEEVDDYTGIIKRLTCQAVHKSYFNPLVVNESSPGLVVAGCEFKNGYTGAPLLDLGGRVKALISKDIEKKYINYLNTSGLLLNPLKKMFHATNMACAPTLYDSDVLDEAECGKTLDLDNLDHARASILSSVGFYAEARKRYEEQLEANNIFIKLKVKFAGEGNSRQTKVQPHCFKKISNWVENLPRKGVFVFDLEVPMKNFKKGVDSYGRLSFTEENLPPERYKVQISAGDIRKFGESDIYMWNAEHEFNYPGISEVCSTESVLL